ncbi:CPBP family intramembrane glutamic endopeptidase [Cellvibrio zantedeschiae]|uniref:CPBP family intramembrane glutamic endopeptidase n=1 Tax=Cellvibrio zantedeschiae TaxID=1237077 RepID=UPI0016762926|nr:type II CAAX endopeptidase family protein [Cellvibrio zantedeschiae]
MMAKKLLTFVGLSLVFFIVAVVTAVLLMPQLKNLLNNDTAISPVVSHISTFVALVLTLLISWRRLNVKSQLKSYISCDFRYYGISLVGVLILFILVTLVNKLLGIGNPWVADLMRGNQITLAFIYFTILVLAPLNEEIIFRGFALNIGNAISGGWISVWLTIVISCGGFALLHTQYGYTTVIYLFVLAVWFAIVRIKSQSLSVPIVAHSFASLLGSLNI